MLRYMRRKKGKIRRRLYVRLLDRFLPRVEGLRRPKVRCRIDLSVLLRKYRLRSALEE